MPNLEVGKGITFRPKSNWFSLTMRFRMQNMVGLSFDKDFTLTKTDAQVKRLRPALRRVHRISPKLVYSVQLGFTSYDTEPLPSGNMNIVRDAIVYYVPRRQVEHRVRPDQDQGQPGAHQLVERPAVRRPQHRQQRVQPRPRLRVLRRIQHASGATGFNLSAKGSVTLGEGRNWGSSSNGGLAYTGRLELYPLGRFKSKGDVLGGETSKARSGSGSSLAGAYSLQTTRHRA